MKILSVIFLILFGYSVSAQSEYKEYSVCIDSAVYKGKKNHGKYYCTSNMQVREYKNGKKDTLWWSWSGGGNIFIDGEYEKYERLSERGKYIVDSLQEDGIMQLQQSYLTYEPMYMKQGQKVKDMWAIRGNDIIIYKYKIWNTDKGFGVQMVSETKIN